MGDSNTVRLFFLNHADLKMRYLRKRNYHQFEVMMKSSKVLREKEKLKE